MAAERHPDPQDDPPHLRVVPASAAPPPGEPGTTPSVAQDPVVAAAPSHHWRAWLLHLVTAAKGRLAGASLLLIVAFAVEGALLWFFGDLAGEVAGGETRAVDEGLYHWLRTFATPSLDEFGRLTSAMGAEMVMLLLTVLTLYFFWRRRFGAAVSLMVVTTGAQLLNNVLKDHFRRTRPTEVGFFIKAQAWSFPSGHAMVSAAFYAFLIYVGWQLLRGTARVAWVGTLTTLVLLIGLSRLYLGAHYLTDVIAGYTAGVAWTGVVIVAGHILATRRWRRVAVAHSQPRTPIT